MQDDRILDKAEAFSKLPPIRHDSLLKEINGEKGKIASCFVIIDDDPTGTQTFHDVPILTTWSEEILVKEFRGSETFFILTNSRSIPPRDAEKMALTLGKNLRIAAKTAGVHFIVDSRSDSTLRGHFPLEVDALAKGLSWDIDAYFLIPYFFEGGRFTLNDIHYVQRENNLVPVALTEFARDTMFSYTHSNLKHYIEEKTDGRWTSKQVISVSIDEIREGGPSIVTRKLLKAPKGAAIVVNACDDRDLEVFVLGLLQAEKLGKKYIYRSAASFARVRAGISKLPVLEEKDLASYSQKGGLVIVGSYIKKTTEQLYKVLILPAIQALEINVHDIINIEKNEFYIESVAKEIINIMNNGKTVVAYTSREFLVSDSSTESFLNARKISDALCKIVSYLQEQPKFLIAKGGITSNDIATKGLHIKRARVLGQLQPGVPVWELGFESKFPGMKYVVYPGNVGSIDGLALAIKSLSR